MGVAVRESVAEAVPSVSVSVVPVLVTGLLGEEPFELGSQLVAAGQFLVARQQGPILLCGNERIVLALQPGHHLGDLGAGLYLLVDLAVDLGAGLGKFLERQL